MRTTISNHEPPVQTYSRMLIRLHTLNATGNQDSPEVDSLCDEMDAPGYALNEIEHERVGGLSEDLYSITEGLKSIKMTSAERVDWSTKLTQQLGSANWDHALELLRHPPDDLPTDLVALLQTLCWEGLGDPLVARVFMDHAQKLNPNNRIYATPVLLRQALAEQLVRIGLQQAG
jgi:hypothetical protein